MSTRALRKSLLKRLIGAAFILGIIGGLLFGAIASPTVDDSQSFCVFKLITDLPCLFCGMTRATIATGAGDFAKAWELNPLVFVVDPLLLALGVYWVWPANARSQRTGEQEPPLGDRVLAKESARHAYVESTRLEKAEDGV